MPLLLNVHRILKTDGSFVFSRHQPMNDFPISLSGNYFCREQITDQWDTIGEPVEVTFYRRPLTEFFQCIAEAGLYVTQLNEGKPSDTMQTIAPEQYAYLSKNPNFIFFECKKHD